MPTPELPHISWCTKCVLPSSSAIPLTFDERGVCSACRVQEKRAQIDWDERLEMLRMEMEPYRRSTGYDCVIGVSGGKDSYYQVHFVKEKLGMNPLLVTYDGNNYLDVGWRNLMRMKEVFKTDHIILRPSVDTLVRMNRLCFRMMGDMNWHGHCGIVTLPMRLAAQFNIPIVFWGEHGHADLGGMHSPQDLVEYTRRYRLDQHLRGYDWYDMIGDAEDPIRENELELFKYPDDEEILRVGLRGIYVGMYDRWDANAHAKLVQELYGWEPAPVPFERTYRRISNLDDRYENGIHDYLKYVKFGYGRGTDHACKDIRHGYMSREQGIEMVRRYDHVLSSDLCYWLRYIERDEKWFHTIADGFRDPRVWLKDDAGNWHKRNIWDQA